MTKHIYKIYTQGYVNPIICTDKSQFINIKSDLTNACKNFSTVRLTLENYIKQITES